MFFRSGGVVSNNGGTVLENQKPGEPSQDAETKKKKKRDKVRSAWISFVGRIVAQVVGAVATVVLGVMVLQTYAAPRTPPASSPADAAGDVFVAVVPMKDFSRDPEKAGNRVRITVQLIERDDTLVDDVLALQTEIAGAIARALNTSRGPILSDAPGFARTSDDAKAIP
jgi:flagellar basal body-associated protein FliL